MKGYGIASRRILLPHAAWLAWAHRVFLDSMTELWADLDETFDEFTLVPERFEVIGDYVLVSIYQTTKLPGSDDRVESRIFHVWRVKHAVPQEAWSFADRAEALEAVGLRG